MKGNADKQFLKLMQISQKADLIPPVLYTQQEESFVSGLFIQYCANLYIFLLVT